ncbi:cobalamin biosynthesis protein CbiX [Kitasatospora sp. NPDC088351]|uniref:cobalamin biosynthesis protein CbiX n=1 Tax=unclassified Kitasatospora TaxID=2633591 RepID=UPI00342267DE
MCGHESANGEALEGIPGVLPVGTGRRLFRLVRERLRDQERLCVVPMTLGRDPALVADAARTLLALEPGERARVVLSEPFGTAEHLVGWLRAAASRLPAETALLVTAPTGGPSEDAELYRIARLVWQYGRHRIVEVGLTGGDPDPAAGARRCRRLGAAQVTLLPAAFVVPRPPPAAHCPGPLLTPSGLAQVLRSRAADAWQRRYQRGADGIAEGLAAGHGHSHEHRHDDGPDDRHHDGHGDQYGHGHRHDHRREQDHQNQHGEGQGHAAHAHPTGRSTT